VPKLQESENMSGWNSKNDESSQVGEENMNVPPYVEELHPVRLYTEEMGVSYANVH